MLFFGPDGTPINEQVGGPRGKGVSPIVGCRCASILATQGSGHCVENQITNPHG